ncbi:MAG: ribonuclease E/G, partial [Desulfocapsaceae bacterium]
MSPSENDGKPSEKPNLISKIKTTTGAWWKSRVVHETQEPAPQESASNTDTEQPKKIRKSRSPGKKSVSKLTSAYQASADSQTAEPVSAGSDQAKSNKRSSSEPTEADGSSNQHAEDPAVESTQKKGRAQKPKRGRGRKGTQTKSQKSREKTEAAEPTADQPHADEKEKRSQPPSKKEHKPVVKLLINADEPEECRLALLEDGRLESLHVTTISRVQTRNNIYKARVVAVEPNLQAAFVDYGVEKNGFLAFSEIHPEYYKQELPQNIQKLVETHQWKKLSISDVIAKGQEMLVQVVKEEVGKKGANLTTYLSIPGRCVVLMPGSDSEGISRKISGEERRGRLREIMNSLSIPEGIGWIV